MTAHPAPWATGVTPGDAGWDWLYPALRAVGLRGDGFPPSRGDAPTDGAGAPQIAVCALSPEPASAKEARDFAQATLRGWALEELVEDVAVAVSELVTNALRYGRTAEDQDWAIRLGLFRRGERVLCAVTDPGDRVPAARQPDYVTEAGRGLYVVASLSETWGWAPSDRSGKVVWATFSVSRRGDSSLAVW